MYKKQTDPRRNAEPKPFNYFSGRQPDDRHWITRLKEALKKINQRITDEDINNIWQMYSCTNGNLKRWLQDDTLLSRINKEPVTHADMESIRQTIRKISDTAIKQVIIDAR
jgi:hypothetical protein